MKIGTPVFKQMGQAAPGQAGPNFISSDCQLAGHHIAQGIEESQLGEPSLAHPITLLRRAYGI
jgi:hypothetical protein